MELVGDCQRLYNDAASSTRRQLNQISSRPFTSISTAWCIGGWHSHSQSC
jgi:hypothetical protein